MRIWSSFNVKMRNKSNKYYYHLKQIFLSFHWPRDHHVTCKQLPTNNSLLMHNAIQQCLAANNILLMRKGNRAFLLVAIALASNDKTILELGYRKISWLVSVSQINYLPQPLASANNWSARHRKITIFCSTSSNNC